MVRLFVCIVPGRTRVPGRFSSLMRVRRGRAILDRLSRKSYIATYVLWPLFFEAAYHNILWVMIFKRLREEIESIRARDPAARSGLEVALCYPGFHALLFHKAARAAWNVRLY